MLNRIPFAALPLLVVVPALAAQTTLHASLSTAGVDADKNAESPAIATDGRYVVFDSTSAVLDPADTSSTRDVFRRDLVDGTLILISYATNGRGGDRTSSIAKVSPDGNLVVFESTATNLVSGDSNNKSDIFVRDVAAGTTTRVSVSSSGAQGGDDSTSANLTPDGVYVVFDSLSTNLVSGDANGASDIFRRDRVTGTTVRVSLSDADAEANGRSNHPSISADGNLVAFESRATNLGTADSNGFTDIYLRDIAAGTTRRISVGWNGSEPTNDCFDPQISADGRFVAFSCYADNLVPHDTNGIHDVFVVEVATGAIERASVNSDGIEGDAESQKPSISDDGRFVGFISLASNLAEGDWNNQKDLFVRDRLLGMTSWMSLGDQNQTGSNTCEQGAICGDGSHAVFASKNRDFVATDLDAGLNDVFVRQRDMTLASWSNYGSGLAGTLGTPAITLSAPPVLNTGFDVLVTNSNRWFAVAVLLVGKDDADVPAWGGRILVDPLDVLPIALWPGTTAFPQEIPPDEFLSGDHYYLQALELDPGAPHGISMTPGLDLVIGF